jgi:hypothetical protein
MAKKGKLFSNKPVYPYKEAAENSKRWWEKQGYKVEIKERKGKKLIAGRTYTGYYQLYIYK